MQIVSNNPLVKERFAKLDLDYVEGEYKDVLLKVKDHIINDRYTLLSHPLSGSIKPNETYYKSILVNQQANTHIDMSSLEYIESAIQVYDKFFKNMKRPTYTQEILEDFATIDYFLIKSALESANIHYQ